MLLQSSLELGNVFIAVYFHLNEDIFLLDLNPVETNSQASLVSKPQYAFCDWMSTKNFSDNLEIWLQEQQAHDGSRGT